MPAEESVKSDMISLRLKPETHEILKKKADEQAISKSELISTFILDLITPGETPGTDTNKGAGSKVGTSVGAKVGRR